MDKKGAIVIGAGLAGCEAAWVLANAGWRVRLYEARPEWRSPAHTGDLLGELVCSNSLRSEEEGHATALLKEEMRALGSLVMEAAYANRVPAGKALAVDREGFSKYITAKIISHTNIELVREEIMAIDDLYRPLSPVVIASGPLTSPSFSSSLASFISNYSESGAKTLYFYDAIAPVVEAGSIDMDIAFRGSRYDVGEKEEGDYLNCPLMKEEYDRFIEELLNADKIKVHEFDEMKYFEGCMPVETMAERHKDALRHGPMKPMGLIDPRTGKMPYALVQLRQDDLHATLFNMVGFQTRMTYPEQERVFRMIPGLKNARFARLGSMHRNTYINGPLLLNWRFELKERPGVFMAGQITGVEGYLESAATGIYVGKVIAGGFSRVPPPTTAIGSLIHHVTHADPQRYQPMKIIWGLFPLPDGCNSTSRGPRKDVRKQMLLSRARSDFKAWLSEQCSGRAPYERTL